MRGKAKQSAHRIGHDFDLASDVILENQPVGVERGAKVDVNARKNTTIKDLNDGADRVGGNRQVGSAERNN